LKTRNLLGFVVGKLVRWQLLERAGSRYGFNIHYSDLNMVMY